MSLKNTSMFAGPLKLVDTAGIHDTTDKVEKIGVERSRQAITQADLILLVLDQSEPLTTEDKQLLAATADKKRIIVLNKQDLPARLDTAALLQLVDADEIIKTAIPTSDGMDALDERIAKLFFGGIENSQEQSWSPTRAKSAYCGKLAKAWMRSWPGFMPGCQLIWCKLI